ncbi:Amino acid/amide ABC transporter membrane protein 2, HAAT family [Burkholderiales bacterium]|nr:Amino acid/amide ABC transporter membrane protein 2, HAAT family [Burkholderiales bacterium]
MSGRPLMRWLPWLAGATLLVVVPAVFSQGFVRLLFAECAIMIVFALSYNLLLGASGMLSFGHAVYSGFGAYAAIHALNWIGRSHVPLPVTALPLVGGIGGLAAGVVLGFVSTRRSGTAFAMITLGLGELVAACWLMFPRFFGGEGGVPGNRTVGTPLFGVPGWNLGSDLQIDYVVGAWCFASVVAVRALLGTPLGRVANAVRDNPERAEFVGYSARQVRWLMLMAASFFAGISGALQALNFEIVSAENVGAVRSGEVLLATYIGGIGYFHGPILGAVVFVFFAVALSQLTKAWQLYLGMFFVVLVLKAPGGLAGVIARVAAQVRDGLVRQRARVLSAMGAAVALALCGLVLLVEMTYHRTLDATQGGSIVRVFWTDIDTDRAWAWVLALLPLVGGVLAFDWVRHREIGASQAPEARASRVE